MKESQALRHLSIAAPIGGEHLASDPEMEPKDTPRSTEVVSKLPGLPKSRRGPYGHKRP